SLTLYCISSQLPAASKIYALSLHDALPIYGCPTARTSCDQRNCWIAQSCVRYEFMKQLTANIRNPKATISRGSTRRMTAGTIGKDRKSTRLNSSHLGISYAVFCLKKKTATR